MIKDDLSFEEYQEIDAVNISSLKMMRRSPAHYFQAITEQETENNNLLLGSLVHCLILQPETFDATYIEVPKIDRRTKEGKEQADYIARKCDLEGLIPVAYELAEEARIIAKQAGNHPYFRLFHTDTSRQEISLTWTNRGVDCKGRIDHYDPKTKTITDIKTTKDASPEEFSKSIYNFGYHNQAAWYIDGCKENGLEVEDYILFVIEKDAPYCIVVYRLNQQDIALARAENDRFLSQLIQCRKEKHFVGYPEEIQEITIPTWAVARTDKSLMNEVNCNE